MGLRSTRTEREVCAGCYFCYGEQPRWVGPNAQGLAAQHHDRTGHPTWVSVVMKVYYGGEGTKEESREQLFL